MNCQECNAPISPAFKAAIAKNECPGCGGKIMSESTVTLMQELKEAMEKMPNDPEGLAGWLLSNYRMEKVGDAQPTGFYGKSKNEDKPLKIANNPLQKFLKQTGQSAEVKDTKYKALAEEINSNYSQENDEQETFDVDIIEETKDPEFTKQVLNAMGGEIMKKSIGNAPNNYDKDLSKELENNISSSDLHPALQQDRLKRLERQKSLKVLGSVGFIKRSE